jgi:hypothetical protein
MIHDCPHCICDDTTLLEEQEAASYAFVPEFWTFLRSRKSSIRVSELHKIAGAYNWTNEALKASRKAFTRQLGLTGRVEFGTTGNRATVRLRPTTADKIDKRTRAYKLGER